MDVMMLYKLFSCEDLLNSPPMESLIKRVMPASGLAALYGSSGSGKSFLVLNMALAIARGVAWFGYRTTKAPVTYIFLEGEIGSQKRIAAYKKHFSHERLPDELRFITQSVDLLGDNVLNLAEAINAAGANNGLVIVDTLNRAAPGADENSPVDMGKIISSAKTLQNLIGGIVLLVHHTGKDATKGLRGHSSLFAALDSAIEVVKKSNHREWRIAKSKDDVTGDSHSFNLEPVSLGFDSDGDEITSCIVLPVDIDTSSHKKISLTKNPKIALNEIRKKLINPLQVPSNASHGVHKSIDYEEAVLLVSGAMTSDARHRKDRAKKAIDDLIKKNLLTANDNFLRLT